MAPAERKKIKQQIEQAKLAEQQKRLEELIAAEKEKDPDALEEYPSAIFQGSSDKTIC